MSIENAEPAARNPRGDVAAAEADVCVGGEHLIIQQRGFVIVRIDWLDLQVIRKDRVVRRKGGSHNFVESDTGPGERAVNAANEARGVTRIGPSQKGACC